MKGFLLLLGTALLGVGIWGMVIGGHNHELIVFGVNANHNSVHTLSGAMALVAAMSSQKYAKIYCLIFGAIYGVVTVAGFLNVSEVVQLLNLNQADNLLHLAISAACVLVGARAKAT